MRQADRDWNSWDDAPRTVDEHIELYRQKLALQNSPPPAEAKEPDFFQVVTGHFVVSAKIQFQCGNVSVIGYDAENNKTAKSFTAK